MLHIAAFADEIDPDINVQIAHCRLNGVTHIELRSVDKINVLDLSPHDRQRIRSAVKDAGMGIVSIGSPIGKVAIDRPFAEHMERFKIAVDAALFFEAPLIRVFSYYPVGGEGKGPIEPHRDEVIDRFRKKVEYVASLPVTIVHENEKGIFGEKGLPCLDLMQSINSPKLRSAFDFANFVQAKEKPLDNWKLLKPFSTHIHIKDARMSDGHVVPAGDGDGDIETILVDAVKSGYQGWLSLEPHLQVAGHSHGETGPALFKTAADALKKILDRNAIAYPGSSEQAIAR